jgi:hypothetical protein
VLRKSRRADGQNISAVTASDEALRGILFGNPLMHMMKVYRERVDILAARAITGGAWENS